MEQETAPDEGATDEATKLEAEVVALEQGIINAAIAFQHMSAELTRNDAAHLRALYSIVIRMYHFLLIVIKSPRCFQAIQFSDYWIKKRQKPKKAYVAKWVADAVMRPGSTQAKESAARISAILQSFMLSNVPENEVEPRIRARGGIQKCYLALCPAAVARADIDLLRSEPAIGTMPAPEDKEQFEGGDSEPMIGRDPRLEALTDDPDHAAKGRATDNDVLVGPATDDVEEQTKPAGAFLANPSGSPPTEGRGDDLLSAAVSGRRSDVRSRFKPANMLVVDMCPDQLAALLKAKRAIIRVSIMEPDEIGFKPVLLNQAELSLSEWGRWPDIRFPSDDVDPSTGKDE
jgi:hypothetical protein